MIRTKKYLEAVLETDLSEDVLLHPAEGSPPTVNVLDVTFTPGCSLKRAVSPSSSIIDIRGLKAASWENISGWIHYQSGWGETKFLFSHGPRGTQEY